MLWMLFETHHPSIDLDTLSSSPPSGWHTREASHIPTSGDKEKECILTKNQEGPPG